MSVKITDLPQAPSVQDVDKLEIVDVSDPSASPEGTSKHITVSQLPFVDTLGALTDVTITTPQNGDLLIYNGAAWVNADPGFGALAFLDTVGSAQIDNGAVTSDEIAAAAVGSDEIAAAAVGTSEIAADAVTTDKIAPGAVGTEELASGNTIEDPTLTAYRLTSQTPSSSGGILTIPYGDGNAVKITLTEDTALDVSGWPANTFAKLDLCVQQNATGGHALTIPPSWGMPGGGTGITVSPGPNMRDRFVIVRDADGTIDLTVAGQDYKMA